MRKQFDAWRKDASSAELDQFEIQASTLDEAASARQLLAAGLSPAALTATDDLRVVDYLVKRPDVDEARIGCMGLSFGSFRTNYLAALDSRVKAAVSVCWIGTISGAIHHNLLGAFGFFALPPHLYRHFDLPDLIALSAPKPFLAISGWNDPMLQPTSIADAHLFLRKVWSRQNEGHRLGSLIRETGHCFDTEMQSAAFAFLDAHLMH